MKRGLRTRRRSRTARETDRVATITTARRPLREEVDSRASRYLVSMAIRTACVVLAVVTDGFWRWAFIAGAVLLPYLAVVLANAGRERVDRPDTLLAPPAITAGPEGESDRDPT